MPPKVAQKWSPLPSGTLACSKEVPASPAPQSSHLIQRESSGKYIPPLQNQAPLPPKESTAPTASWVYLHHNLCVGGQGGRLGSPPQGSPPQGWFKGKAGSEAVPAAAQGEEQGPCPGELGAGSLGTTDISKPQHWGAGEEVGVTFSSKCLCCPPRQQGGQWHVMEPD